MKLLKSSWILIITLTAYANPVINSHENTVHVINRTEVEENFLRKLNMKCNQRDNHSCMMLKLIIYINRIIKKPSIDVYDNLKLTQTREVEVPDDPEDDIILSRALNSDSETLGVLVAGKIWKFIKSRTVRYKLYDNADVIVNTEPEGKLNMGISISPFGVFEEGRGKMKNLGPIIAVVAAKVGLIVALLIKGLIVLTGKALIVSKIALILAVLIGLRKFLNKKRVTYEVLSHPAHTHETPHTKDTYSSGWSRALGGFLDGLADLPAKMFDAHDIAFGAQKPKSS